MARKRSAFSDCDATRCATCGRRGEVIDSREILGSYVRRQRSCPCGERWTTKEIRTTQRGIVTDVDQEDARLGAALRALLQDAAR